PYSPNILFTAIAVLTKLTTRQHLRASLIGKIPSVAIEVILGHDLIHFSEHGMRFVILFILTLGGFFMQRKYRKHKYHNND
ncbi:MAG: TVP38/TMEM64 family protein, partial [Dialister sp.]|nr:TVP38/TMEM64 family protein [Dialister sp.]